MAQDPFPNRAGSHRSHSHDPRSGAPFSGFPFDDPFFANPFGASPFGASGSRTRGRSQDFYAFSDPFTFFDRVFEDVFRDMNDPFFSNRHRPRHAFGGGLFIHHFFGHDPFLEGPRSPFGFLPSPFHHSTFPFDGQAASFSSSTRAISGGDSRWVSQSQTTRIVNGVTESVFKRIDSDVSSPF